MFKAWREDSPYAFVKDGNMLEDYANRPGELLPEKRPFEHMKIVRRLSFRPLVLINLNKFNCPEEVIKLLGISPVLRLPG